jgi:SAM-dependent methyltransferase
MDSRVLRFAAGLALGLTFVLAAPAMARQTAPPPAGQPYEPTVGMAGKDVVWVPTPPETVEKMLDMAKVTANDYVIDLGSGDGRNVIGAARRGARALGVEYNPDMVELSRRLAKEAGVADKAQFVQGDMYEADISKATVMALFLLPTNLDKLKDKILALKPGTRVVMNTFTVDGWEADETDRVGSPCTSWCTVLLHIVPAKVEGTWRDDRGEISISQQFQKVSGARVAGSTRTDITNARLRGDQIAMTIGDTVYTGRVEGDRIVGSATRGGTKQAWTARRQ